MEWISVKDRLPEINNSSDYYLVFGKYIDDKTDDPARVVPCFYEKLIGERKGYFFENSYYEYPEIIATHWMPLPEGPKELTLITKL